MITYIIFDSATGLYKIGKTKNMKKRFSTLSTSNLNLHIVVQLYNVSETLLHTIYKYRNVKKEWFRLQPKDIEDIKELDFETEKLTYYA